MSEEYKLPNGLSVFLNGTPDQNERQKIRITKRHEFCLAYCREKGWPLDLNALTYDQVMEINQQPGWLNPV